MIEKRPIANFIGHLVLIIGVIIVAFPIYYTFVASSRTSVEIIRPPMSLDPRRSTERELYGGDVRRRRARGRRQP